MAAPAGADSERPGPAAPTSPLGQTWTCKGTAQNTNAGSLDNRRGSKTSPAGDHDDTLIGRRQRNVLGRRGSASETLGGGAGNDSLYGDGSILLASKPERRSPFPLLSVSDVGVILQGAADGNDTLEGGRGKNDQLHRRE